MLGVGHLSLSLYRPEWQNRRAKEFWFELSEELLCLKLLFALLFHNNCQTNM